MLFLFHHIREYLHWETMPTVAHALDARPSWVGLHTGPRLKRRASNLMSGLETEFLYIGIFLELWSMWGTWITDSPMERFMWESSWMTLVSHSLSVCLSVLFCICRWYIYIFYLLQLVSMMACMTTSVSSGVLKCMVWWFLLRKSILSDHLM